MPSERRVAWIPGGGRGIGRAAALALAHAGHDVAVSARNADEIRRTAEDCRKLGVRAMDAVCDLTDPAAIERAHASVVAELGHPGILVNSAGIAKSAPFAKTSADFMEMHWKLNVMGPFHATRLALPAMVAAKWGRVVNVASVAGKVGAPYIAAYATSKHALLGLTRSLAAEYATKGVTVNAVCPSYVNTQMTEDSFEVMMRVTGRTREEALAYVTGLNPQKRLIEPEEVASVIVQLASVDARGISGQAITIDGGAVQW